ncbi:response regulator transcription factor [Emergencia timonensis]|uniref:response regulator transcription factor n=1 Tax=Emergencia timonensis TaxID=1776384 RepID=UPI00399560C0
MIKILIAEDDRQLNEGIKLSLREEGRNFLQSYTLTEARTAVEEANPDLLILDVNFPDGSGLDLLREIKSAGRRTKIILLTANNMETDIVTGLESGADDYITKPFSLMVLRARVGVQLRKADSQAITEGDFLFDFERMIFSVKGQTVELSKTEQKLLRILVENKGKTVSRELLIDGVWDGDSEYVDGHALTVTIKRLRDKLGEDAAEPQHIKTVYGIGYCFQ